MFPMAPPRLVHERPFNQVLSDKTLHLPFHLISAAGFPFSTRCCESLYEVLMGNTPSQTAFVDFAVLRNVWKGFFCPFGISRSG